MICMNVLKDKIENEINPRIKGIEKAIFEEFKKFTDDNGIREYI